MDNNLQDIEDYLVEIGSGIETLNSKSKDINLNTKMSYKHLGNINDAMTTFYVDFMDMFKGTMLEIQQANKGDEVKERIAPSVDRMEVNNVLIGTLKSLGTQIKDAYGPNALKDKMAAGAGGAKDKIVNAARPGSLVKTGGLFMNSPALMMMGDSINKMTGKITDTYKLQKEKKKEADDFNNEQAVNDEIRTEETQTSFLEGIFKSTSSMAKGIMELVKNSTAMGLGLIAALVAGPILLLIGFFQGLGGELKWLGGLKDGWLAKKFEPLLNFFKRIGSVISESKVFKAIAKWADDIKMGFTLVGDNLRAMGDSGGFLGKTVKWVKGLFGAFTKKFMLFGKIFKDVGRLFGKLFIPLTFIMSAWDFISGAIDGFKATEGSVFEKIMGALKGGLWGLFDGLVGSLVSLMMSIVGWIMTKLGFGEAAKALTETVNKVMQSVKDAIGNIIDLVTSLFTGDGETFKKTLTKLWDDTVDFLLLPVNTFISMIRKLFSFAGIKLPKFDLKQTLTDAIEFGIVKIKTLGKGGGTFEEFTAGRREEEDKELMIKEKAFVNSELAKLGMAANATRGVDAPTTIIQTDNRRTTHAHGAYNFSNPDGDASFENAALGGA